MGGVKMLEYRHFPLVNKVLVGSLVVVVLVYHTGTAGHLDS